MAMHKDRTIVEVLKRIVYDAQEAEHVRKSAYFGITSIDRNNNLMIFESFSFPGDVDWEYLDSLTP